MLPGAIFQTASEAYLVLARVSHHLLLRLFATLTASLLATLLATLLAFSVSCQSNKGSDSVVTGPSGPSSAPSTSTSLQWENSNFLDATGNATGLVASNLSTGGPATPLSMTYAQANQPVALFTGGTTTTNKTVIAPVPFLAFVAEPTAAVTVRDIKSVNGQNISSNEVVPVSCPSAFVSGLDLQNGDVAYCVPLINIVIPSFLLPTDSAGAYVHQFNVTAKTPEKNATVLTTNLATTIVIPPSNLSLAASPAMSALSLYQRLTMVTDDLVGSPRRDFQAFEISGTVAPGTTTSWVLTFSDIQMTMTEEIFFEQPVVPGNTPSKPTVSRGSGFYKRSTSIESIDNFRLRIQDGNNPSNYYNVGSTAGANVVTMPITDPTAPLNIYIIPDFGNPDASQAMSAYVKPFGPTFCPTEQSAFQPQEWLDSRGTAGFVACDATLRKRIIDAAAAQADNLTTPQETFFGSFSYLPRIGANTLGGTDGILDLRVSLSGSLTAAVVNPSNSAATTAVGTLSLNYSYQFPTALTEINNLLSAGTSSPGLDTIAAAMATKGIFELPPLPGTAAGTTIPAFPFLGISSNSIFY